MTVSSTNSRIVYSGNGATTSFATNFRVDTAADLVVIYTDASGNQTTLTSGQYSTDGAFGSAYPNGPTVTYNPTSGPIATGTTLTLYRNAAATQPNSMGNQGALWPTVIEGAIDRVLMVLQQYIGGLNRSLQIGINDSTTLNNLPSAATRANGYLGFDSNGQPTVYAGNGSSTSISSAMVSVVQASTTALARAALSAVSAADTAISWLGTSDFTGGRAKVPTRSQNDNGTDAASTAYADRAAAMRSVSVASINFNSGNTDTSFTMALPTGYTRYRVDRVVISNASHSLTTATCGLFTAAAGGGTAVVTGATAITVSATSDATANNMQSLTPASAVTSFQAATLYFRVQTAEGAAATGDVTIFYEPLP